MTLIKTIANGLGSFFIREVGTDPIVRLFQVEYNKEFRALQALGVQIDRKMALEHMGRQ